MTQTPTRKRPAASFSASTSAAYAVGPPAAEGTPPAPDKSATSNKSATSDKSGKTNTSATTKASEDIAALVGHCARGQSYLPESVMTALTLLAVPGSRPLHTSTAPATDPAGDPETSPAGDPETSPGPDAISDDPTPPHAATVVPREISDARWTVITNLLAGYTTPELPTVWAAQEIDLIEATDRVTAWAHHLQLGAIARLREAIGAHCEMELTPTAFLNGVVYDVETEADAATVDEVALVTGLPVTEAHRRMQLASGNDGRSRVVLSRLHEGRTTLDRCLRILDATSDCHPDDVNIIAERVLAELPDGSKPSHQLFMRRLRRQVVLHQPDPAQRHADAVSRRTAFGELLDDGSGILTITGDGERVVAALDRVDALARSLRAGGDSRNLSALRSDVALDLLLVGWPSPPDAIRAARTRTSAGHGNTAAAAGTTQTTANTDSNTATSNTSNTATSTTTDTANSGTDATDDDLSAPDIADSGTDATDDDLPAPADLVDLTPWLTLKQQPPAHVNVIVSLPTLLGEDDATAEIPGHGFITGAHARQLAMAAGSVWRRLVTDPLSGAALDLSTQRYRPTRRMVDVVAALDGVCRAPGCAVPARQCDIDHAVPWPRGSTEVRNLSSKHRRHHNHKTRRTWLTVADADGTITWRTIGRRDYVTERYRYVEPSHGPATDTEHARVCATEPPLF